MCTSSVQLFVCLFYFLFSLLIRLFLKFSIFEGFINTKKTSKTFDLCKIKEECYDIHIWLWLTGLSVLRYRISTYQVSSDMISWNEKWYLSDLSEYQLDFVYDCYKIFYLPSKLVLIKYYVEFFIPLTLPKLNLKRFDSLFKFNFISVHFDSGITSFLFSFIILNISKGSCNMYQIWILKDLIHFLNSILV